MFRILLGAIIGGGILAFAGFNQLRLANTCEADPTPMTVDEINAAGLDGLDNAHILLGEFYDTGDMVYETATKSPTSAWKAAWVPVIGGEASDRAMAGVTLSDQFLDGGEPTAEDERALEQAQAKLGGGDVGVVLKFTNIAGPEAANRVLARDTVRGVAINQIESIDSETRRLLEQNLRGIDVDKIVMIEVDRDPPGSGSAAAMLGGGAVLAGGGVAGGLLKAKRRNG